MRRLALLLFLCIASTALAADDWGPLQFLVGKWTGEGAGQPGNGSGGFTFTPGLQGKILTRTNFAEYPPANGRPAFRHDDLMIVYRDEARQLRATYWDNEGHVIQYSINAAPDAVVFLSDGSPSTTRYRFTYTPNGQDRLKIKFEIAQPGKDFATYIEASAKRDK